MREEPNRADGASTCLCALAAPLRWTSQQPRSAVGGNSPRDMPDQLPLLQFCNLTSELTPHICDRPKFVNLELIGSDYV